MAVIALAAASVWLCGCGGSGSGSGLECSMAVAGQQYCYTYSNLSSENAKSVKSMCSNQGGSIVNSCPRDGLVGCCALSQRGMSFQQCYYFGTASTDKMACTGTWTDGSAALGNSGGGGTTTSGKTSTTTSTTGPCVTGDAGCSCYPNKTCNGTLSCVSGICAYATTTPTCGAGNGLCCPANYCTTGAAKAYQFAYSDRTDGGESSAMLGTSSRLCVSGTAMGASCDTQSCFSTHWGGGLGVNLNQAQTDGATAMNFTAAGSAGVTYSLDNFVQGMRIVVGDSKTDYCVNLVSGSGTIPWRSFNSACWNGTGVSLSGPPANFTSIRFQVASDAVYDINIDFNFCVTQLSL
ncbi:MAG TPA: hypothetical protein VF518_05255 [Polyangia bacterium]